MARRTGGGRRRTNRRRVRARDVVLEHPSRREPRRHGQDRLLDPRDPPPRHAAGVALVERRHHLVFEQRVQRLAHRRRRPRRDRSESVWPSISQPFVPAEPFGPPAVADAEVQHAVHRRLHAARAARLERLARGVQPHVAALHEQMRDVQIVVVDERDAAAELGIEARDGRCSADGASRPRRPGAPCRRTRAAPGRRSSVSSRARRSRSRNTSSGRL